MRQNNHFLSSLTTQFADDSQPAYRMHDDSLMCPLMMRFRQVTLRCFVAAMCVLSINSWAHALAVGTTSGTVPATTVNPANYDGWTQGDPGWGNVTSGGNNYVYLGDGWMLSARHVGPPVSIVLPTGTFQQIGDPYLGASYYSDYGVTTYFDNSLGKQVRLFTVANPPGMGLTPYTDLQLFRINGDPGLPAVKIANEHFDLNPFPSAINSPELVMVGQGNTRAANEVHWNVDMSDTTPPITWTWTPTEGSGNKQGYYSVGPRTKAWGTNRLANTYTINSQNPGLYSSVVSNTTGVVKLTALQNDTLVLTTSYDKLVDNGATAFEAQALGGDSGSGVFYKRNGQWELVGIVNASTTFPSQPGGTGTAIYDGMTLISNLAYYNQDYLHSIKQIMDSHPDYSTMGDVNLDGIVSGNGSGLAATDDVTAFVAGWGNVNLVDGTPKGTITSWKKGDLNRNGITDVNDFLLLRGALNAPVSGAVVQSLFGSTTIPGVGGVPEPTSACLVMFAAGSFILLLRWRTRPLVG